jgi:hypothetical protein
MAEGETVPLTGAVMGGRASAAPAAAMAMIGSASAKAQIQSRMTRMD